MHSNIRLLLALLAVILPFFARAQCGTIVAVRDTICEGEVAVFRATGSLNGRYTWYYNPATSPAITGETGPTISVSGLFATTTIWVRQQGCNTTKVGVTVVVRRTPRDFFTGTCPIQNNGLVAAYPFNGNLLDISPNANNLTGNGNVRYQPDRNGVPNGAVLFDPNSYASRPVSTSINSIVNGMTLACWSKTNNFLLETPSSGPYFFNALVSKSENSNLIFHFRLLMANDGLISSGTGWDKGFLIGNNFNTNQWYHTASTFDGQKFTYYVDGEPIGHILNALPLTPDQNDLEVGRDRSGPIKKMDGLIDDLRLYNQPLNRDEIRTLADRCKPFRANLPISRICENDPFKLELLNAEPGIQYRLQDSTGTPLSAYFTTSTTDSLTTLVSFPITGRSRRVYVQANNNGCTRVLSASWGLTVGNVPANLIPDRLITQCGIAPVTISPIIITIGSWVWTRAGNVVSTTSQVVATQSGQYITQFTNPQGCVALDTVDVVLNPLPAVPELTPLPSAVGIYQLCQGDSIRVTSSYATGNIWNGVPLATNSFLIQNSGAYTLQHRDTNGCLSPILDFSSTASPIPAMPQMVFVGRPRICLGDSTEVRVLNPDPGLIYTWEPPSSILQGTRTFVYIDRPARAFASNNGCISICQNCPQIAPVLRPTIVANAGPDQQICASLTQTSFGSPNTDPFLKFRFRWVQDPTSVNPYLGQVQIDTSVDGSAQARFVPSPAQQYPVRFLVIQQAIDISGLCDDLDTTVVTILPAVLGVTKTGPNAFCVGSSITNTVTPIGVNPALVRYRWTNGDTTATTTISRTGTYGVTMSVGSCNLDLFYWVDSLPLPNLQTNGPGVVCTNDRRFVINISRPETPRQIITVRHIPDPFINYTGSVFLGADFFLVRFSMVGTPTYPVISKFVVTVFDSTTGCSKSDTVLTTINESPLPFRLTRSGPLAICEGGNILLTGPALLPGQRYLWSTGATSQSIVVSTAGRFRLSVINPNGCTEADSVTTTLLPFDNGNAGPPRTVCASDSFQILNTTSGGGRLRVFFEDFYDTPANPPASVTFDLSTLAAARLTFRVNPGATFPFRIGIKKNISSLVNGCVRFDTTYITVQEGPTGVKIKRASNAICAGDSLNLVAGLSQIGNANPTYSWTFGGLPISTDTIVRASRAGQYILRASIGLCTVADTFNLIVNPLPSLTAGPDFILCYDAKRPLGPSQTAEPNVAYRWSSVPTNPIDGRLLLADSNVLNPEFDPSRASSSNGADTLIRNYRFALRSTNNLTGCTALDTATVTLLPSPVAQAGADQSICSGGILSLGSPKRVGHRYRWAPSLGLSSDTVAQPVWSYSHSRNVTDTLRYVLTAEQTTVIPSGGSFVCTKTDTIILLVRPKPRFRIAGNASVCPGVQGVPYTALDTNSVTWQWITDEGSIAFGQGQDSITINWPNIRKTQSYVKAISRSIYGCSSDTMRFAVRVLPKLEPGIPIGDTSICADARTTTYQVPRSPGSVYTWTINGGQILSGNGSNQVTVQWAGIGIHTIWYRENVTADTICEGNSPFKQVRVNPVPSAARIVGTRTFCGAQQAVAYSVPGFANSRYDWRVISPTGTVVFAGLSDSLINLNLSTPGDYRLSVRELTAKGCAGPLNLDSVLINALPQALAGTDRTICSNSSTTLGSGLFPNPALTYTWSPNTYLSNSNSFRPQFAAPTLGSTGGQLRYILTVQNRSTGCSSQDTVFVNVNPEPIKNGINTLLTACQGDAIGLALPGTVGYTYSWQPATFLVGGNTAQPTFRLPNRVRRDSTLSFISTITDTTTGCIVTDTVQVQLYSRPVAEPQKDTSFCAGNEILLGTRRPASGVSYSWKPAQWFSSPNRSDPWAWWPTQLGPASSLKRDTTITITMIKTNDWTGCRDSTTFRLTARVMPSSQVIADTAICEGEEIIVGLPPTPTYRYRWVGASGLSNDTISQASFRAPILQNGSSDSLVRLLAYKFNRQTLCSRLDTLLVTVKPKPRFTLSSGDTIICAGQPLLIDVSFANPNLLTDFSLTQDGQPIPVTYPIRINTDNNSGSPIVRRISFLAESGFPRPGGICATEQAINVTIRPMPMVSLADNNPWLCPGKLAGQRYQAQSNNTHLNYTWRVEGGGLVRRDSNAVIVSWDPELNPDTYRLIVVGTTPDGCQTSEATFTPRLDPLASDPNSGCDVADYFPSILPNVITPDVVDGKNDYFVIDNIELFPNAQLRIWNRLGVLVYEAQPYTNRFRAEGLPTGTYFYQFDTGRGKTYKGWIEVLK